MPIITRLIFQKNKKRVNIYLDGQFAFGLTASIVLKKHLKAGKKLSNNLIQDLLTLSLKEEMYEKALHFLSLRPRSEKEISDYLKRKLQQLKYKNVLIFFGKEDNFYQLKSTLIGKIVARLRKNNLVNDLEFARWFIQQRLNFRPRGKRVLKIELRRKGVDLQTIEEVFADEALYSSQQEYEGAKKIAIKAWRQLQGKKTNEQKQQGFLKLKQRLYQRLASRGFSFNVIKTIVDDLVKEE